MRLIMAAVAIMITPVMAGAETWLPMKGQAIASALGGRSLTYDNAYQEFYASGRTLYNAGRDSWGYWQVRGDRYCSQWPPGDQWDCYDMEQTEDGSRVRFLDDAGNATVGTRGP